MPNYLVEGYFPRSRAAELSDSVARLRMTAEELTAEGTAVRLVRSSFLPSDELVLHVLEAESAEAVGIASKRAGIASERIVEEVPS
jgi:hypothetical protein